MANKKKLKKNNNHIAERKRPGKIWLPEQTKQWIAAIAMFLAAAIIVLSFFDLAGMAGKFFMRASLNLLGNTVFILPLIFILGGIVFLKSQEKRWFPVLLGILFLILGIAGIAGGFSSYNIEEIAKGGGWISYIMAWPLLKMFGFWVTEIVFSTFIIIGTIILWQFVYREAQKEAEKFEENISEPSIVKKIFAPKFNIKEVPPPAGGAISPPLAIKLPPPDIKTLPLKPQALATDYQFPPVDLLEPDRGQPTVGDIKINSAIIKRTLQNFDIPVEMSEVNIGPAVTQYTFKPAEGVKLSKITALSNDLSLALASHPIRIEAPIPGRPLVGIEVPNRSRTMVRLRNLIENSNFQNSVSSLTITLGRDVAGNPVFADLARMPHLLVAGSTGTGKTICLNSLILSLLYRNSPETLRFILIDPKRVEFAVYANLPHLLTPVIFDAQKTINALKWLVGEMERRFDVLSAEKSKDIDSYREKTQGREDVEPMPYIILIVDELADLMASRGREVEAGIVRLAQMARAVGIHLVVATQRPSVEVITGLIKANITSRITFQVASQIDSRTVIDSAGAEKLLGQGDMLFLSAEISKPKRIQGVFVSEKEVKKVMSFIKSENEKTKSESEEPEKQFLEIAESLEKTMEAGPSDFWEGSDDPLYEEAKKVVIESKKASASLLQRRLRIGYARAARLIDTLEEKGVVGPGEGAKPREIYGQGELGKELEQEEDLA